jgi:ABC-type amino acid transport substrate-binding protein
MNIKRCTLTFCSFFFTLTATAQTVDLSDAEQAWVEQNPTVTYCVDPDWVPFEHINKQGQHVGISADLLQLVASRVGLAYSTKTAA